MVIQNNGVLPKTRTMASAPYNGFRLPGVRHRATDARTIDVVLVLRPTFVGRPALEMVPSKVNAEMCPGLDWQRLMRSMSSTDSKLRSNTLRSRPMDRKLVAIQTLALHPILYCQGRLTPMPKGLNLPSSAAIGNMLKLTHKGTKLFRWNYSLFRTQQFCSRPLRHPSAGSEPPPRKSCR